MMNRLKLALVWTLLMGTVFLMAQENAGQAGEFLRYGIGGRALGMGRAFTALSDDASSVYWNPAGMMGAERVEFASMYSNLYYDTQYANVGVILPRMMGYGKNPVLNFLLGPSSAVGLAWVGLSMIDFQQRTEYGEYLGDFDMQENALLLSWAHESVSSWGVLRYGATLKGVTRSLGGLQVGDRVTSSDLERDLTWGVDAGLIFQPIHMPGLRWFSLRYLLPLRFGVSVKNILQPQWRGNSDANRFPRTYTLGLAYNFIIGDWLPESWLAKNTWVRDCRLQTVFDYELSQNAKFFGMEAYIPVPDSPVDLIPRWGVNTGTEGASLGMGLAMPFAQNMNVRIDYAYEFHPFLKSDNRFFITLQTGSVFNGRFFLDKEQDAQTPHEARQDLLLLALAQHPQAESVLAARRLSANPDTSMKRRYYQYLQGLDWADLLYAEAQEKVFSTQAGEYHKLFTPVAEAYSRVGDAMTNRQRLNYAEALLMVNNSVEALEQISQIDARDLKMRGYYLKGVAHKMTGSNTEAEEAFNQAISISGADNQNSIISLSFLGWAESRAAQGNYRSAIRSIDSMLKEHSRPLAKRYPRVQVFDDRYIVDEAVYLRGLCQVLLSESDDADLIDIGIDNILSTEKYYPGLDYGRRADDSIDTLLSLKESGNYSEIRSLCRQLLSDYLAQHQWPMP